MHEKLIEHFRIQIQRGFKQPIVAVFGDRLDAWLPTINEWIEKGYLIKSEEPGFTYSWNLTEKGEESIRAVLMMDVL